MALIVTFTGDADKYLVRGAIWDLGPGSYRAYVHAVSPGLDPSSSTPLVGSVNGPTLEKALDAAIALIMTAAGTPVENLRVVHAPRETEVRYAAVNR